MGVAKRKQDRRLEVFGDTYAMWTEKRLTQAQAAEVLGVCERTFRRWVDRYREDEAEGGGVEALRDRCLSRASHRAAPGATWDLIVTMDDATNEQCSMFFCGEEGVWSSFRGMREAIKARGLCCSLYTDRASHYWLTPEAAWAST